MIPGAFDRAHAALLARGWATVQSHAIGLPGEREVVGALSPSLRPDPRGAGKLHARDVVHYDLDAVPVFGECESIAHVDGTNDYPRFLLTKAPRGRTSIPAVIYSLIPPSLRRPSGRLSADYFRYSPGTGSPAHQDKFGDLVFIWVLDRNGDGAESFLTDLNGRDVMRGPIGPGQLLVFRDEMFLHGVTELKSGRRDALIFITLKDGA